MLGLEGSIKQTFDVLVLHTPHGTMRFPLPWTVLHFRLPHAVRAAGRAERRGVRDRHGRGAGRRGPGLVGVRHGSRRGDRAARGRRPRVAPCAGHERIPAARRAALARPRGASGRVEWRAGDLDRPLDRAGRLWLELPGERRGACRGRLLRPPLSREGADGRPGRAAGARRRALPGQLDPAQAAARRRGGRVLRRRLRRPLPPAHRRRHPHRVLLRHRARAASCAR